MVKSAQNGGGNSKILIRNAKKIVTLRYGNSRNACPDGFGLTSIFMKTSSSYSFQKSVNKT